LSTQSETAFAKVNLALHVRGKMDGGYHRIETIFAFCEDGDRVSADPGDNVTLEVDGPFAPGLDTGDGNLVTRAAQMLQSTSRTDEGATIRLTKLLPQSSGLGGGSADAAAALRLLNRLWKLDRPNERLESVARGLGADIPACVWSRTSRGEGRGDQLTPVDLGLSGRPILIVNPRSEVPTAEVFERWDGVDRGPLTDWRHGRNDLQKAASEIAPLIGTVLAWLSAQSGADCVRMSGSGSSCFALFRSDAERDRAEEAVPREWWRLATRLR
jgi:4-diphosphocytidyl-2-C-methyl-D-erythritol kinase